MASQEFNNIVKKLLKNKNKIIGIEKVKKILKNFFGDTINDQKIYKTIYSLKNKWYLLILKRNIFLVKDQEKEYSEHELLERFYRILLKRHCKDYISGKSYIWGQKALELIINNFDIPDSILIFNEEKQASEIIVFDKEIITKTYSSHGKNLFPFFKKYTHSIYIGKNTFLVADLELAILESLYNPSIILEGYINELVKKILKKYKKTLKLEVWEEILKKNKHHSSINRLHTLSKHIDPDLADRIKGIIRKYGYFIYE